MDKEADEEDTDDEEVDKGEDLAEDDAARRRIECPTEAYIDTLPGGRADLQVISILHCTAWHSAALHLVLYSMHLNECIAVHAEVQYSTVQFRTAQNLPIY
jgi:hypothetical protein